MSENVWTGWILILEVMYGICVFFLAIYGLNILGLALLYLRNRKTRAPHPKPVEISEWPGVTIQLPIYNESWIVERLLKAVTGLDYPCDRLQIQVLDDSTDDTVEITKKWVAEYQAAGIDIELYHRVNRTGYKAGALAAATPDAKWDYIAIFDADFVPPANWLKAVLPEFADPTTGCIQTRWGHLNGRDNVLTEAQTLGIDGHFIVEQGARFGSHLFMGFNGSGGIWRKAAIESAGGWHSDTLTEDLDLSYRAQLKGWRIHYLPEIVVPGELPAQIDAFKTQQFRWAKGSVQTFRKLGWTVLRTDLPWRIRIAAILHLSMYLPFPFIVLTILLTLPVALWASPVLKFFPWTILGSLGPPLLYSVTSTANLPRLRDRLVRIPILLILGLGISFNNSLAVIQGLFQNGGEFRRTPKSAMKDRPRAGVKKASLFPQSPEVWGELILGIYAIYSLILIWPTEAGRQMAPGIILYAISFLFTSWLSFTEAWRQRRQAAAAIEK